MYGNIIWEHTIKYFTNNNIFYKQFGFLSGRSTSLQLLNVLDQWTKDLDEGRSVDCIYMDFQKCFSTVPHRRLLHKLQGYGIDNQIIQWITDFNWQETMVLCTYILNKGDTIY